MVHEHEEAGVTPVVSEYLQAIYNLEMEGEPAHAAALARKFGKSRANVSSLLERMRKAGLVSNEGRGDIELTADGRRQAELALRRHRLAERYLVDALGLDWITAHEEAHHFELGMTPIVEAAILKQLGNPTTCPHGNPIPGKGESAVAGAVRLASVPEGESISVVRVSEDAENEPELLEYLQRHGLVPGGQFKVKGVQPWNGLLLLERDGEEVPLGVAAAQKIWVRRQSA